MRALAIFFQFACFQTQLRGIQQSFLFSNQCYEYILDFYRSHTQVVYFRCTVAASYEKFSSNKGSTEAVEPVTFQIGRDCQAI